MKTPKVGDLVKLNINSFPNTFPKSYGIILAISVERYKKSYKVFWQDIGNTSIWYWESELDFIKNE